MPKTITRELLKSIPKRKEDSHKGQNGKVLIIGGCDEIHGAPLLAGMAAMSVMRIGVDLCVVCTTEKTGQAIKCYSPDLIVKKFSGKYLSKKHLKKILEENKKADVTLIGPGIGTRKETKQLVKELVKKCVGTIILDADAIKACAKTRFKNHLLITPHEKEFEIFCGKKLGKTLKEKIMVLKEESKKHNCTILLKGRVDVITNGEKVLLNKTGNAGMTVGGTGDVLAGICAGLCAKKIDLIKAAGIAAYVNGKIGEKLAKKQGYSFVASDFISELKKWGKQLAK